MKNIWEKIKRVCVEILGAFIGIFVGTIGLGIANIAARKRRDKKEIRDKIRCFNPTIIERNGTKETHWKMRDKPLTDEQLAEFDKY